MAMNRIQFQPGMSLFELFQRFGTETQCEAALEQARWPQGFRCPRCGGGAHCVLGVRARKTFQCNTCHHQTSLIAGTLFESTKLGLTVWFLAMYLISQAKTGLSALALKRDLGVSYPTAWLIHHKLMQAMIEREARYVLCGTVQLDDAYLGGELNDGTAGRTYIPMSTGFMYLAAVIDWYSRYVIAWELSNTLDHLFCVSMLEEALQRAHPVIFNTDQGSQFTSTEFTRCLLDRQILISMDGRGRALDNVFIERLWRSVKYEEVYLNDYQSVLQLYQGLGQYFHFYNHERPHSALGGRTPAQVHYLSEQGLA